MHRMTAWRHYNAGTLPPELQPKKIGNIIYVLANRSRTSPTGRIVGYARVSSAEQELHLENQANRLLAYAGQNGILLDQVVSEIASGLNDRRPKLRKLLGGPSVHTVIVEHRERLARFGVGMVETMLQARGGSLVVIDDTEVPDDLVRDTDRDTDLLLRSSLRQTLRWRQGAASHGDDQWLRLKGKKRKQPSSCPRRLATGCQGSPAGTHLPAGTLRTTLRRHRPLRLQPHGRQRPGRPRRGPLAHAP